VDDHYDNLEVARTVLSFHGATVETARNGVEGLHVLESFDATVILMDLSMPEMNGWEMFEAVRGNAKIAHLPVIAVTAHARSTDESEVKQAGFTGYISKPFSVATFVGQIQEIIDTSKQAKDGK
jgi:two-component system cell cycle response regulator DivK